jgi:flavin-dependent dehydrogenase
MLLRHAEESGARVFEETKITDIDFKANGAEMRPVSATYKRNNGEVGQVYFDYLVDASGRNGIVSTKVCHLWKMRRHDLTRQCST